MVPGVSETGTEIRDFAPIADGNVWTYRHVNDNSGIGYPESDWGQWSDTVWYTFRIVGKPRGIYAGRIGGPTAWIPVYIAAKAIYTCIFRMSVKGQIKKHISGLPEPKRSDMHELHRIILEMMPACKSIWIRGNTPLKCAKRFQIAILLTTDLPDEL